MAILSQQQRSEVAVPRVSQCTWLKRVGVAGFIFFLVKGLLWLIVPALLYYFGVSP